jgi:hypothetical protein
MYSLTLKPGTDGTGAASTSNDSPFIKKNKKHKKNQVRMSIGGDMAPVKSHKLGPNKEALENMLTRKGAKLADTNLNHVLPLNSDPSKLPAFLFDAIADVEERGMHQEGIFRKSSKKIQEDEILNQIKLVPEEKLHKFHIDFSQYSDVYLPGNMMKKYLRALPEPLLTFGLYHTFLKTQDEKDPETSINMLQKACRFLPESNYVLLKELCRFLKNVSNHQKENFMTTDNLALVWQPNLLYMKDQSPVELFRDLKIACGVVISLIDHWEVIFDKESPVTALESSTDHVTDTTSHPLVESTTTTTTTTASTATTETETAIEEDEQSDSQAVYSGDLNEEGQRHGKGKLMMSDGRIYTGDFVHNEIQGKGEMVEPNGSWYVGDWLDGMKEGKGVMHYPDKCRYEGTWKADMRSGRGMVIYPDGSIYDGQWLEDKPHGRGIFIDSNECKYVGEWQHGRYHGKGTLQIFTTNEVYEGEFVSGEYEGKAKYTSNSTRGTHVFEGEFKTAMPWNGFGSLALNPYCIYSGEWREGAFFGNAYMRSQDEREYEGGMENSQFSGTGTMKYPDGSSYTGEWKHGKRHGEGTQKSPDGTTYDGEFKDGMFDGLGTLTSADGTCVFNGEFKVDSPWEGEGVIKVGDDVFDGVFKKGMFYGTGKKKNGSDGSVYEGQFEKTEFHGHGKLIYSNGSMFEGEFKNHQKYQGILTDKFGVEFNVEYDLETGEELFRTKHYEVPSLDKKLEVFDRKIANIMKKMRKIGHRLDLKEMIEHHHPTTVDTTSGSDSIQILQGSLSTLARADPNNFAPCLELIMQLTECLQKEDKKNRLQQQQQQQEEEEENMENNN